MNFFCSVYYSSKGQMLVVIGISVGGGMIAILLVLFCLVVIGIFSTSKAVDAIRGTTIDINVVCCIL